MFSVDTLERNASKGHGLVTSVAAANNVLLVGTNKGWLVHHDFAGTDSNELDLSTRGVVDQWIHKVFIDPGGRHSLATICSSVTADTYYIHGKWKKPRVISRLKGMTVSSVAWNRQQINEAFTREVILGTTNGQLYETAIEEKDKKEKYVKLLFEITEAPEPFIGVQMETVTTGTAVRYFVMAATPSRLYIFQGTTSLEAVFMSYAEGIAHFTELPGEIPNSELHFYGKQRRSERFAWLAGPGIYHGHLNLGTSPSANHTHGGESNVESKWLLEYSKIFDNASTAKPCSLALTEFHFLLLSNNLLKVVNRVSQKVVEEERFDSRVDLGSPTMLGLCSDTAGGAFYAFDENSIYEITVQDEGRDMWQVYSSLKEYTAALEHCRDSLQRDCVYAAQAEAAFEAGDYSRAASFYAKTTQVATFEEVALKFVSVGESDALRTYLLRKLDYMSKEDRSQITMVSTWAAELYLDKINRLLLVTDKEDKEGEKEENSAVSEYQSTVQEFRAFLSDCKDVLDEATTVKLLGSYGRVEELVFFAGLKEQYETLIHHYVQQGDAKKALAILQKPSMSPELQYKFAPALIMLDPHGTVDAWTTTRLSLEPRRLIPALMRYSIEPHPKDEPNAAIRYLEYCIRQQQNEDSAVHNLLLSLYARQAEESALLQFLDAKHGKGRLDGPDYFYDPKYALRLCLEEKRMRACVYIYGMMHMHEEAIALALQVDPETAKLEADKVEDNEELRKKLWLMIAKHVVQQGKATKGENIRKAIAFLKETDGLLKIEDILPFFPDFSLIDDFKEAICTSLEDYNRQIEELKRDMVDATHGAENIRNDISALTQRYAVIKRDETCRICGERILAPRGMHGALGAARSYSSLVAPFYVFPCEHAFHADCLTDYVIKHTDKSERDRIRGLLRQLTALGNQEPPITTGSKTSAETAPADGRPSPIDQLRAQLDDAVAGECPFCGELMIKEIGQAFIGSEDSDLVVSWALP
ncbi:unnamed protein product [Sphagnum jensenii]|uniref:Pep3/Vps18/deep orange domain-containing protein n=1 Tax=Sphagnum jensenii TaxID=128206 RepID=A0ABP0W6C3_9BRYO